MDDEKVFARAVQNKQIDHRRKWEGRAAKLPSDDTLTERRAGAGKSSKAPEGAAGEADALQSCLGNWVQTQSDYFSAGVFGDLPPRWAIEERIHLMYEASKDSPAEALAFGYCDQLDRTPTAFVLDLGELTLNELAGGLARQYSERVGIGLSETKALMGPLFSSLRGAAGRRRLKEHWATPVREVEGMAEEVAKRQVAGESSEEKPEARIAYAYVKLLGYTPSQVVAELGPLGLDQLAADFVVKYAEAKQLAVPEVQRQFNSLLCVQDGDRDLALSRAWDPPRAVSRWRENAVERFRVALLGNVGLALADVLKSTEYTPREVVGVLASMCRKLPSEDVVKLTVGAAIDGLEEWFFVKWRVGANDKKSLRKKWFGALRQACLKILDEPVGGRDRAKAAEAFSVGRVKVLKRAMALARDGKHKLFLYEIGLVGARV